MNPWDDLDPPYSTIVADPPWHYGDVMVAIDGAKRTPLPYSTMTDDQIAALPVADIAAPGAHLFLWTTDRHLWVARDIIEAWGFRLARILVWAKPPSGYMMSGPFTTTTEFVLYARFPTDAHYLIRAAREAVGISRRELRARMGTAKSVSLVNRWEEGACLPTEDDWRSLQAVLPELSDVPCPKALPPIGRVDTTWWEWPRGAHSVKPAAFMDVVEQVAPGPYVELFARQPRLGWDSWGWGYEISGEVA